MMLDVVKKEIEAKIEPQTTKHTARLIALLLQEINVLSLSIPAPPQKGTIMEPKLSTSELRQLGLDNLNSDMRNSLEAIKSAEEKLKQIKKDFGNHVLQRGIAVHNESVQKDAVEFKTRHGEWEDRERKSRELSKLKRYQMNVTTVRMQEIAYEINTLNAIITKKLPRELMRQRRKKTTAAGINTNFRGDSVFLSSRERKWLDSMYDKINKLIDEFEQIHNTENPGKPLDRIWKSYTG